MFVYLCGFVFQPLFWGTSKDGVRAIYQFAFPVRLSVLQKLPPLQALAELAVLATRFAALRISTIHTAGNRNSSLVIVSFGVNMISGFYCRIFVSTFDSVLGMVLAAVGLACLDLLRRGTYRWRTKWINRCCRMRRERDRALYAPASEVDKVQPGQPLDAAHNGDSASTASTLR